MDLHDIALRIYIHLAATQSSSAADGQARLELGRQAYRDAEAYLAAKDAWIRDQPIPGGDASF